jgi:hypothetical protein
MRRSLPYGRHLIVPLLLLALVHAWTPRVLWHWHDCSHRPALQALAADCASTCPHQPVTNQHPADFPAWQTTTDSDCDFSFDSFYLPPSGALAAGVSLLLPVGLLSLAARQVPQPSIASTKLPTGRAPPTCG